MLERVMKLGNMESIGALKQRIASFNTDTMSIVDQVRATAPALLHTVDSSRLVDDVFESIHTLLTPLITAAVEPGGLHGKQVAVDPSSLAFLPYVCHAVPCTCPHMVVMYSLVWILYMPILIY